MQDGSINNVRTFYRKYINSGEYGVGVRVFIGEVGLSTAS